MKRLSTLIVFTLFILSSSFSQSVVWKEVASLPEGYYSGEAVSLNNEIYLVAGRNDKSLVADFLKYNPVLNTWAKLANIPSPAINLALAAANNKIYAIGGDRFQNSNREYDPQSNTWKLVEPMPTARQHIDCGVHNDKIYISGGLTSWKDITKKHEVYDPKTNSWSSITATSSIRQCGAVVTVDKLIYYIGGAGSKEDIWADLWTVESYDIESDKWELKNNLPQLLYKPSAVKVNNNIIVLGGQTLVDGKTDATNQVFIYNPQKDEWKETTPLPVKNVFFGCTTVDNKIYVTGGTVGGNPNWAGYKKVYVGEFINQ